METTVLIFGQLTDITGAAMLECMAVPDTDALQQQLHQKYPGLAAAKYVIAVDKIICHQNTVLRAGSTVALLPPFSGG